MNQKLQEIIEIEERDYRVAAAQSLHSYNDVVQQILQKMHELDYMLQLGYKVHFYQNKTSGEVFYKKSEPHKIGFNHKESEN